MPEHGCGRPSVARGDRESAVAPALSPSAAGPSPACTLCGGPIAGVPATVPHLVVAGGRLRAEVRPACPGCARAVGGVGRAGQEARR
jgi:hypothetical protein